MNQEKKELSKPASAAADAACRQEYKAEHQKTESNVPEWKPEELEITYYNTKELAQAAERRIREYVKGLAEILGNA